MRSLNGVDYFVIIEEWIILFKVDYKSYLLDFKSLIEDDPDAKERVSPKTSIELSSSLDENRILKTAQVFKDFRLYIRWSNCIYMLKNHRLSLLLISYKWSSILAWYHYCYLGARWIYNWAPYHGILWNVCSSNNPTRKMNTTHSYIIYILR